MGMKLEIASPCAVPWSSMSGDDRVRFCGQCRMNVYNLSELPESRASELVREAEGRVCVRFYQRRDGTVMTADCPAGRARRLGKRALALAAALVSVIAGTIFVSSSDRSELAPSRLAERFMDLFRARTTRVVAGEMPPPPPVRPARS